MHIIQTASVFLVASLLATGPAGTIARSTERDTKPIGEKQITRIIAAARAAMGNPHKYLAMTRRGTFVRDGGAPNVFDTTVDLRNGFSRTRWATGRAMFTSGYDGAAWDASDGTLTIVSLPSLVADAVTEAYLNSIAFLGSDQRSNIVSGRAQRIRGNLAYILEVVPRGGSPAELYFDAVTSRLTKVVEHKATGIESITFDDFRTVQGVTIPFRSVDVSSTGSTIALSTTAVRFSTTLPPGSLARTEYASRGRGTASIGFTTDAVGYIGHIVVPMTLDGKLVSLIFDSGGTNLLIPQAAAALGVRLEGNVAVGVGDEDRKAQVARVSSLDFDGAALAHQLFFIRDLPYEIKHPRKGVEPQGIVGFQHLANFRVSVRYAQRRIDFEPFDAPAPVGGVTLPFKSDGAYAYVDATLDGVRGYYLLDTGNAGGITLNGSFVAAHHLFSKGGIVYNVSRNSGADFAATLVAAKSFVFAGQMFRDVPAVIPRVTSGFFAMRGVAGTVGSAFLSRFTCVFNYKSQTVTFIPNRNLNVPFLSDRTGLDLTQSGPGAFNVVAVLRNSPGAEAGVKPGDRILEFSGKSVSNGYGLGDFQPYLVGNNSFSITFSAGGVNRTAKISPRSLVPPAQ